MNEPTQSSTTTTPATEPTRSEPPPASEAPASKNLGITITQAAVDAAAAQIAKRNVPGTSLRVGIRGGGCSGFSYVVEFHDGDPRPRDVVYDMTASDGSPVRFVVDKKSLLYLNGATFDWEKKLMRQGFKFVNPNEKSSCGCGTSFTV